MSDVTFDVNHIDFEFMFERITAAIYREGVDDLDADAADIQESVNLLQEFVIENPEATREEVVDTLRVYLEIDFGVYENEPRKELAKKIAEEMIP